MARSMARRQGRSAPKRARRATDAAKPAGPDDLELPLTKDGQPMGVDSETPDDAEWDALRRYKSFRGLDLTTPIKVGQHIYIQPDNNRDEYWIGQVTSIRARDNKAVFIAVAWMFTSVPQMNDYGIQKAPKQLSAMEVCNSNIIDRMSVYVVNGLCPVVELDDSNPLQEEIEPDWFWYNKEIVDLAKSANGDDLPAPRKKRKSLTMAKKKKKDAPGLSLEPVHSPSCLCKKPYEPLPLRNQATMVYCPNTTCRKWYHTKCLLDRRHFAKASPQNLNQIADSGLTLRDDYPFDSEISDLVETPPTIPKLYQQVVAAAQASIERGGVDTGMVGNGRSVVIARGIHRRIIDAAGENAAERKRLDAAMALKDDMIEWWADWGPPPEEEEVVEAAQVKAKGKSPGKGKGKKAGEGKDGEETKEEAKAPVREWVWICPGCKGFC